MGFPLRKQPEPPRPAAGRGTTLPFPHPGRRRARWFGVLAGIVLAAGGAVVHHARPERPSAPPYARTITVRPGRIDRTVRLTGSTAAEHSAHLRAPYLRGRRSSGAGDFTIVIEELAEPGVRVRKGQTVAKFDRLHMQNRLDNRRAERVEREADVATLEAELEAKRAAHLQQVRMAKGEMDKAALDLKTIPIRSAIEAGILRLAFGEAQAEHRALLQQTRWVDAAAAADLARARLDLRDAAVEERRAEANLERMIVRAPIDGLFIPGEIYRGGQLTRIRAGDQVRRLQTYAQIVDPRSLIVKANANQADFRQLRLGTPVHVGFDAFPDLKLPGRLRSAGPLGKSPGRRQEYVAELPVVIGLDRTDPRVIPNLSASAEVVLRSEQSAGIVPREAVFYPERGGLPFLRVRTPSGWQNQRVELGLSNNISVAIQSGVDAGEVVDVAHPDNEG